MYKLISSLWYLHRLRNYYTIVTKAFHLFMPKKRLLHFPYICPLMSQAVSYFKRPLLLSYRGILMLILIAGAGIMCSGLTRKAPHYAAVYIMVYVIAVLLLLVYQASKLHYFGVSDKALIIRNSLFPWKYKEILLTKVKSIRIDTDIRLGPGPVLGSSSPYYLKVFFESLEQERFFGGTLGGKQWSLLTAELGKYQVRVINTCLYVPLRDVL